MVSANPSPIRASASKCVQVRSIVAGSWPCAGPQGRSCARGAATVNMCVVGRKLIGRSKPTPSACRQAAAWRRRPRGGSHPAVPVDWGGSPRWLAVPSARRQILAGCRGSRRARMSWVGGSGADALLGARLRAGAVRARGRPCLPMTWGHATPGFAGVAGAPCPGTDAGAHAEAGYWGHAVLPQERQPRGEEGAVRACEQAAWAWCGARQCGNTEGGRRQGAPRSKPLETKVQTKDPLGDGGVRPREERRSTRNAQGGQAIR